MMVLGSVDVVEQVTIYTPLGIRFWDASLDVQVSDGLAVVAWPESRPGLARSAFRTSSGIYAFQGLPGMHDVEYPPDDAVLSPLTATRFVVQVADTLRRFLPAVFRVDLPYQGIFPTNSPGSPPGGRAQGFYLFSAPTRPSTPSLAVVRAQLVDSAGDPASRKPAAYAVLDLHVAGQTWYGVADDRGTVAALFPYPTFTGSGVSWSPPGSLWTGSPIAVTQQHWDVSVGIRYAPSTLTVPPGATIPDLRSIFSQPPGVLWPTLADYPGHPSSEIAASLVFDQELTLRTDNGSTLMIGGAGSPV
jgi:hypothetical protein